MIEQVCVKINDLSQLRSKQLVQDALNIDSEGNEVELILVNEGQERLCSGKQTVYTELNLWRQQWNYRILM